jgi:hypothetical protein
MKLSSISHSSSAMAALMRIMKAHPAKAGGSIIPRWWR